MTIQTKEVEILIGNNASRYIDLVAKLRLEYFKEFPYLYEGNIEYEKKYVTGYTLDKKSMIAVVKINGEVAGISTGIPLISDSEIVADIKKGFQKKEINIDEYYYYGEVIILPKFRGLGLSRKLFEAQDKIVKEWGFRHVYILTVIRENNHPLKPKNYKSPDVLWKRLGFLQIDKTVSYHWSTIQKDGSVKNNENTLQFWIKNL